MLSELVQQQRQAILLTAYLFNCRESRMVWDISATEVEFLSKYRKDNHWLESQSLGPFLSTLTGIKPTCLPHWLVQGEMSLKEME